LKGHGFSRAAKQPKNLLGFSPGGMIWDDSIHPSAAKAVPFQNNESFRSL
jgi:hypothetical protein